MSLDFQQFRNQLLAAVDILAVVRERVELKRAGTRWQGRCPFHNEKTASFGVTPSMQIFKCFGCGAGGNAIDFVMRYDDMTFWEACKELAERYGVPLPARTGDNDPKTKTRAGIYEAHEIAQRLYRAALQSQIGQQAREYLQRRGVTPAIAEEFGLGLSDRNGQGLTRKLQREGFTPEQLLQTGLVGQREGGGGFYDRFRGRLMFPIQNEQAKVIAYGGRALGEDDQPKYLNSPETELYRKSFVLYNLHRARKPVGEFKHAILVEGYMDVIGLAGGGVGETVASCGTALGDSQVRMIHRYTDNIIVNFDSDNAGVAAAERSIQILLREGMHIRVLELPGDVDPDEFIQTEGADAYRALVASAPRYFHWLRDRIRGRFDLRSAEGKAEAVRELLPSIRVLRDKFERAAVAAELAHDLSIDKAFLLEQVKSASAPAAARPARPRVELPPNERVLLHHLLHSSDARQEALPRLAEFMDRPGCDRIASHAILLTLTHLGPDFAYESLQDRLSDRDKSLLASLVFADESSKVSEAADENSVAQVLECLDRLEQDLDRLAIDELKARIRAAEESGQMEVALQLSQELQNLTRHDARRRSRPAG
jgi:DNA primase